MKSEIFLQKTHQLQLGAISDNTGGILSEMLLHHYQQSGKMLRPLFGFRLAQALSLDPEIAIPWCAACEMLHNATLIHDDLQDGDKVRRNQKTVWSIYGANQAINAGDFLLTLSPRLILNSKTTDEKMIRLIREFSSTSSKIVEGQSIEFTLPNHIYSQEINSLYEKCISFKTSQLFVGLAKGVGILSGADEKTLNNIETAFRELGSIFQIQDDLLDLYGDKLRGNDGNDIKEGKISSLVVSYLELFPKDGFKVMDIILKDRNLTTQDEINFAKTIFTNQGPLEKSLESISDKVEILKGLELTKQNETFRELLFQSLVKTLTPIRHLFSDDNEALREETWAN